MVGTCMRSLPGASAANRLMRRRTLGTQPHAPRKGRALLLPHCERRRTHQRIGPGLAPIINQVARAVHGPGAAPGTFDAWIRACRLLNLRRFRTAGSMRVSLGMPFNDKSYGARAVRPLRRCCCAVHHNDASPRPIGRSAPQDLVSGEPYRSTTHHVVRIMAGRFGGIALPSILTPHHAIPNLAGRFGGLALPPIMTPHDALPSSGRLSGYAWRTLLTFPPRSAISTRRRACRLGPPATDHPSRTPARAA